MQEEEPGLVARLGVPGNHDQRITEQEQKNLGRSSSYVVTQRGVERESRSSRRERRPAPTARLVARPLSCSSLGRCCPASPPPGGGGGVAIRCRGTVDWLLLTS